MYDRVQQSVAEGSAVKRFLFARGLSIGRAASARREAGRSLGPILGALHGLADRVVFSKVRERTGGRLRFSMSGGAALEAGIARFFHAIGLAILEGYGQTETSPIIATNTPEAYRIGTVGKPFPGVEVRLADEDREILVRGPNVMKGYYRNEAATAEAFTPDGWLKTGDIGEFDADGFLRITDRKKDLFKTSGGKYVAPSRVENLLKLHPLVNQVVAIGERRKFISVLIVPDFDRLAKELGAAAGESREAQLARPEVRKRFEEALESLSSELASYELPKKFALLPRELTLEDGELTPTQKVKRKVVEEKYAAEIDAMYR